MMDDGLPQQICYECLSRIEMFHSYKQSCLESQLTLKRWNERIPQFQEVDTFTGPNKSQEMHVLDPFRNIPPPSSETNILTNLTEQQSSSQGIKRSLSSLSLATNNIEVSPPKPSLPQQTSPNVTNQSKARSRETNLAEGNWPRPSSEPRSTRPEPEPRKLLPQSPTPTPVYIRQESEPLSRKETCTKSVQRQNDSGDNKRTPKKSSEQASTEIETDSQSSLMPKFAEAYSQNTERKKDQPKKVQVGKFCKIFTPVSFEVISPKLPQIVTTDVSNKRTSSPKTFAPTISESVKQRKRSSSVSPQSTPRKPKKRSKSNENTPPQSSPTIIPMSDESNDFFAGFGPENLTDTPTPEEQNSSAKKGSGGKQVKTIQGLLKIEDENAREYDNDMDTDVDSVDYRSDIQSSDRECPKGVVTKRPPTSGPKNPLTAFVKVERLPSNGKVFGPESGGIPPSRIGRPRSDNNYYRFVKTVICEETGKEKYQCLQCSKLISYRTYVKEHMMIRSGERPEKCNVCAKSFRNKQILKIHKNTHVQNREYKCEECGHIFPSYMMLRQHMRHHYPLNYDCKVCGKKCSQQSALTLHMRKHTGEKPFKCEHCSNCFKDRTTWANHVRIHTGERPFKCKECDKTFARLASVRAHKISVHSNERPFKCPLCDSAFKMKAHLEKHLACIHKEVLKSMASFVKPDLQS